MNWYKIIHAGSASGRSDSIINSQKLNRYITETVISAKDLSSAKKKARNFTDVKSVRRVISIRVSAKKELRVVQPKPKHQLQDSYKEAARN